MIGNPLVYGVKTPLPLHDFPEGKVRLRMREDSLAQVFVRKAEGMRQFVLQEVEGKWVPAAEIGANLDAPRGETKPVGYWTPVSEAMPDDEMTVLVWVESLGDATLAYHDSEVLARRGDSGWIAAGATTAERALLGVTHWCREICEPDDDDRPNAALSCPEPLKGA